MAWFVSHKFEAIFIHIPKTGGTSIAGPNYGGVLLPLLGEDDIVKGGHKTALELSDEFPEYFSDYFTFCFVRNPYDRLVSTYFYFLDRMDDRKNPSKRATAFGQRVASHGSFDAFARSLQARDLREMHLQPQFNFIRRNGLFRKKFRLDFVGRFERLDRDFSTVCERIGAPPLELPRLRATQRGDYREYYTEASRRHVAELYARDFSVFDYPRSLSGPGGETTDGRTAQGPQ